MEVSRVEGDAFVKVARGKVKVGYTLSMRCDVEFQSVKFAIAVSDLCDYDDTELWEYAGDQPRELDFTVEFKRQNCTEALKVYLEQRITEY